MVYSLPPSVPHNQGPNADPGLKLPWVVVPGELTPSASKLLLGQIELLQDAAGVEPFGRFRSWRDESGANFVEVLRWYDHVSPFTVCIRQESNDSAEPRYVITHQYAYDDENGTVIHELGYEFTPAELRVTMSDASQLINDSVFRNIALEAVRFNAFGVPIDERGYQDLTEKILGKVIDQRGIPPTGQSRRRRLIQWLLTR